MLGKKRHPITVDGRELTPEVVDELVKECEEADPAEFRRRPFDGSSLRQGRISRIKLNLRGHCEEARWKVDDGAHAIGRFAREVRRHRKVKA